MPINSKKSQGNQNMYARAKSPKRDSKLNPDGSIRAKGGQSKITATIKKPNTSDAINITAGDDFYAVYKNESLENFLVARGLTQFRPEMIGSFEFDPPIVTTEEEADLSGLSTGNTILDAEGSVVSNNTYQVSASGELIDMSAQLRQLTYSEMLYFIERKLVGNLVKASNIVEEDMGETYEAAGYADALLNRRDILMHFVERAEHHQSVDDGNHLNPLLQKWWDQREPSKDVINFLSILLSIYDLEEAMEIRSNSYLEHSTTSEASQSMKAMMQEFNSGFFLNKAPGNISLESYLKDVLYTKSNYFENVSNTALLFQIIGDSLAKTIVNSNTFSKSIGASFIPGALYVPGHSSTGNNFASQKDSKLYKELLSFDEDFLMGGYFSSNYTAADGTDVRFPVVSLSKFEYSTFCALYDDLVMSKSGGWYKQVFGDAIATCRDRFLDISPTSVSQYGRYTVIDAARSISRKFGFNPFKEYENITDLPMSGLSSADADNKSNLTRLSNGLLGNDESLSSDTNSYVASLNLGGDSPSGDSGSVYPGKEKYLDNFVNSGDIASGLESLASWASDLQILQSSLAKFLKYSHGRSIISPTEIGAGKGTDDSSDSDGIILNILPIMGLGVASNHPLPGQIMNGTQNIASVSSLYQLTLAKVAEWIENNYLDPIQTGNIWDIASEDGFSLWAMMNGAATSESAYRGFQYAVARDRFKSAMAAGIDKRTSSESWHATLNYITTEFISSAFRSGGWSGSQFKMSDSGAGIAQGDGSWGKITTVGFGYDGDQFPLEPSTDLWDALDFIDLDSQVTDDGTALSATDFTEPPFVSTDYAGPWFPLGNSFSGGTDSDTEWISIIMNSQILTTAGISASANQLDGTGYWNLTESAGSDPDNVGSYINRVDGTYKTYPGFSLTNPLSGAHLFDLCYVIADQWSSLNSTSFDETPDLESKSEAGFGRDARALLVYQYIVMIFSQTQKMKQFGPSTDYGFSLFSLSKRAAKSLVDAVKLMNDSPSSRAETLAKGQYSAKNSMKWMLNTAPGHESAVGGYRGAIEEIISLHFTFYGKEVEGEIDCYNSGFFAIEILQKLIDSINSIISTFTEYGFENTSIADALGELDDIDTSSIQDLILSTVSKEQVVLNRFLYDTLLNHNSDYPYVPCQKAVTLAQSNALAALCRSSSLIRTTTSGAKRIFAIGFPTGLVKFLRQSASQEMSNPMYNDSNIIKISLWRKDLLTDEVSSLPQEFVFDMSKFVLDNIPVWAQSAGLNWGNWELLGLDQEEDYPDTTEAYRAALKEALGLDEDASIDTSQHASLDCLLSSVTVAKYGINGIEKVYNGKAFSNSVINGFEGFTSGAADNLYDVIGNANIADDEKNVFTQIYNNHVLDFYLKLYLKLTMGIDVAEDNFCMGDIKDTMFVLDPENPNAFTGDSDNQENFEFIKDLLISMYPTRDTASSITYDRVLSEISRSIMMSPKKYRNRTLMPKIFDRVFCLLVDEADWSESIPIDDAPTYDEDGNENCENRSEFSYAISFSQPTNPTYHQYYVTVSIMTELDEVVLTA